MQPQEPTSAFAWPVFPFPASIAAGIVVFLAVLTLLASSRFDQTGGLLTISILIVAAFIAVAFTSLLYNYQQTAVVDILVGALATALGAVVSYWMGRK